MTRQVKETGLLPCKCCGTTPVMYNTNGVYYAMCDEECFSFKEYLNSEKEAVEAWNKLQKTTFKDILEASGMNKTQFSKFFNIPYRTLSSWETEERKCPDYVLELIQYKLDNEKKKGDA